MYINPTSGTVKSLTYEEFMALLRERKYDDEKITWVERMVKAHAATESEEPYGLIFFEVLDMCSSQLGSSTVVLGGPTCSNTVDQLIAGRLGDVPSRFKYPTAVHLIGGVTMEEAARDVSANRP